MRFKSLIIILNLVLLLLINSNYFVYADEFDEEIDFSEIESIYLEDVTSQVEEIPKINSRHAVVYDRSTRYSFIWKARK